MGKLHSNLEWAMSNADSSSIADNNDAYSSCVEFNDYVRNLFLGFKFTELETADELLRNADHYNTLVRMSTKFLAYDAYIRYQCHTTST